MMAWVYARPLNAYESCAPTIIPTHTMQATRTASIEVEATMLEDVDMVLTRAYPGNTTPLRACFRRFVLEAGVPLWRYGVDATNNELLVHMNLTRLARHGTAHS